MTSGISGLMGLAFQTIASTGAVPFWQTLLNNDILSSPEMSFFLTRFNDDSNAQAVEPGGVITLGGTNTSFFTGDIDFQPFPQNLPPTFWLFIVR